MNFSAVAHYSVWLQTGRPVFDPWQRQRIFPLACVSTPALKITQPPIQWVQCASIPGVKRGWSMTLITHPHLVPRSSMSRSYTPVPLGACVA